ncbi:hypothetical protein [Corticicoccus populi]|uniref:Uncharacterized protein n=1 Tax=Corticicoccus populi TaxID=1812821 RepID=A0ABW5WY76_9STAP
MSDFSEIPQIKEQENFAKEFKRNEKFFKRLLPKEKYEEARLVVENIEKLIILPSKYNQLFSDHGWIAHESIKPELMEEAIRKFNEKDFESAESYIMKCYEEKIKKGIKFTTAVEPLFSRRRLINLAIEDFTEERYHACIPIILMLVDGVVNDIKDSGLFAESTELEVWDSISGHSEGLKKVVKIYNKGRKKTTEEQLNLPYRNGILHGRDLNYDNKKVALKSFALVFYLSDWIRAYKSESSRKEEYLANINYTFEDYISHKKDMQEFEELQNEWEPRDMIVIDNPKLEDYDESTPEGTAILFINYIKQGNFGSPTKYFSEQHYGDLLKKHRIRQLKETFENKVIISLEKVTCEDIGSAKSKINVTLTYSSDIYSENKVEMELNLNYEMNGKIENRLKENGKWIIRNILGAGWLLV